MANVLPPDAEATDIPAPRHATLITLQRYWQGKCAGRRMPARADIDPAEIKPYLPDVIMYDVLDGGGFRVRLVGDAIVQFLGRNTTGADPTDGMPPRAAATMREILGSVARTGVPRFRAGRAWWWREKNFRDFEACFLPLSPDERAVNIIFGGVTFDV